VSFAQPLFLLGLLAVPAAVALYLLARRRRRRYAVRFTGVETLAALVAGVPAWRRHLPAGLFLVALGALALALARPHATVAVPVERAAVVVIMDASRSMLATDVEPSRMEAARRAGRSFLESVPDRLRVGFVGFSETPHTLESPTEDHAEVLAALESLAADGGTGTGDAVMAGLAMLEDEDDARGGRGRPPAAIVLLSDGRATTGRDPVEAARRAGRLRIPVHTVALGTETATVPTPTGLRLPVPPDPETLREMASVSRGQAFSVEDADELDSVYKRLSSQIGTKEEKREITAGFAAGGIALLLAATGLAVRWTGGLP
jgi:Ca-activated chloride channel family protein